MKNLPRKAIALLGVAAFALLGLVVLAITQARYDTLLVGLIAFICTVFAARSGSAAPRRSVDRLMTGPGGLKQIAAGVARLEHTATSSPRMLEGSSERQIAETAARFDWLARRHTAEAERLDAFMRDLEATVARQHEEIVAQLKALQEPGAPAREAESDGQRTAGQRL